MNLADPEPGPGEPGPGEPAQPRLALVPPGSDAPEPVSELWARHGRALLRFACKLTLGDRYRAEDIVQETLLRAWRHPEIIGTGSGALRPWLFTIARRIAIDMWRARARGPEESGDPCPDVPDPADQIEVAITALDVRNALAALTPAHRDVISELYFNNHSVAEAAVILGVPEGTVKSRAHYATRQLRQVLTATRQAAPAAQQRRIA
jgi:RNA polymerase sigma-70 factor, ECF subfamily